MIGWNLSQEFTAFALGGEASDCNGTYVKAYDGDKESDILILNKAGFKFSHGMIIEFDWSNASFKTRLSAATPFQKASIQHQTIFWSYFPLKVGLFIMNIPAVFDFRVLDMTKIWTKISKHSQAEKQNSK